MSTISRRAMASIGPRDMPIDPGDLNHAREAWRLAALKASAAKEIADRMTEGKRTALAAIEDEYRKAGMRATDAERAALISDDWATYVESMVEARRAARDLEIEADNADRLYYALVGMQATNRAEMRMTGVRS